MVTDLRQRIEQGFTAFGHFVYRHHWKTIVMMVAFIALLASNLPKLTMDTSTEGFLHPEDPALLAYNDFREQFGRDELVIVAVTAPDVFDRAFLEKLRGLYEELRADTPYLDDINSLINARDTHGVEGALLVDDLLKSMPQDDAGLAAIKARALANPVYRNMLLSPDGTITTIVIKTVAYTGGASSDVMAGFDEPATPAAATPRQVLSDQQNSEVVDAVRAITAKYAADNFQIHVAGSPVISDVLKKAMQTNMKRFMGMALLAIGLVLFLMFRRASGVVLPLVVVALSFVSTLGLMGLAGIPFKLPTQILPSFLLAVGVGAAVHLLAIFFHHLQELHEAGAATESRSHKEQAIAYALGHSGLAIVMTSLTTAAGLASFAGAPVAPVSDLGIVAAAGVLLALIYTLVLLPALLSVVPLKAKSSHTAKGRRARMDRLMVAIADFSTHRSGLVIAISALLLVIGIAGATQIRFSHKPFEWLPKSEPARIATDFMDQKMRGASSVEVVVDTRKENGLYEPAVMARLETLEREVEAIDQGELFVGKTLALPDLLKEINKALNENRAEAYTIPTARDLIAQEFLLFENSGSDDLEDFVDSQFSKTRLTAKMPWADGVLYTDFVNDLKQRFETTLGPDVEVTVTGMAALLGRTMHATIISMAQSYIWALLVITAMMVLFIGDLRIGLISMIPNVIPIVLTLGVMGWMGIPLDLFTMLIGSIAIGLAVDDTIHFLHNYRRYHLHGMGVRDAVRKTLLTSGRAMLATSVVLSTGFFLYTFSTLTNLFNFGLFTGLTILTALLADLFLSPALMAQLHKSHLLPEQGDY